MKVAPILTVLLCSLALGDELILKDGKKIEWKALSDEGDTYEVTTPQGTKVTVKKDDVDRLAKSRLPELLTGAQFAFDKKRKLQTLDLLSRIDLKRDVLAAGGTDWKAAGGTLQGTTNGPPAKLQTNVTPPEEYDLTLVVEQKDGPGGSFLMGLIGGGKQFLFGLGDLFSGIDQLNGQSPNDSGSGIPGKFFTKGQARTVTFMVRKEVLIVMVDGKDYHAWKADWSKVSVKPFNAVASQNTLFMLVSRYDVVQLSYKISKMVLTAPKE
jgi:hypothetical protein